MNKIIIVDDDHSISSTLAKILTHEGYSVEATDSGLEVLESVEAGGVGLVITDIIMPKYNGVKLVRELNELKPDLDIIVISGGGRNLPEEYFEGVKQAHIADFFSKPLDYAKLKARIAELMKK